jgi:hypothetical protein
MIRQASEEHCGFAISLDPSSQSGCAGKKFFGREQTWLALLVNGLTFDLIGLRPGPSDEPPPYAHFFGLPADTDPRSWEALTIRPGPHFAGGYNDGAGGPHAGVVGRRVGEPAGRRGCRLASGAQLLRARLFSRERAALDRRWSVPRPRPDGLGDLARRRHAQRKAWRCSPRRNCASSRNSWSKRRQGRRSVSACSIGWWRMAGERDWPARGAATRHEP